MFRSIFAFAAAACLAACGATSAGSPPVSTSPPSSSPLAQTDIDDKAIVVAFDSLGATTTAVQLLLNAKVLKPGSPVALKVADALESAKRWLNVASRAQRAGQAEQYALAVGQAKSAVTGVDTALKGN